MSPEHKNVIYAFVQLFTKNLDQQSQCPIIVGFFSDMIVKESKTKYFSNGLFYHQDGVARSFLKNQLLLSEVS